MTLKEKKGGGTKEKKLQQIKMCGPCQYLDLSIQTKMKLKTKS